MRKKNVVFGFLGTRKEAFHKEDESRHSAWRPNVFIAKHCQQFLIDRMELIFQEGSSSLQTSGTSATHESIFKCIKEDIESIARRDGREIEVRPVVLKYKDAWDFEEIYRALNDFWRGYPFDVNKEKYFVSLSAGSDVMKTCMFQHVQSRRVPADILQAWDDQRYGHSRKAGTKVIPFPLSIFDPAVASNVPIVSKTLINEHESDIASLKKELATRNHAFNVLIENIAIYGVDNDDPVLLTGPTGAGKSELAKRIHELRKRKNLDSSDMVSINCAGLHGNLIQSELFGHVRGAFTDAKRDRAGALLTGNNSCVFLDEIGDLELLAQTKLLKAIEEKKFYQLGADKPSTSKFKLICGTNKDLKQEIKEGRFRLDLYYRIAKHVYKMPALSERKEDIEENLNHELHKYQLLKGNVIRINSDARREFLRYAMKASWPGNFRQFHDYCTTLCDLAVKKNASFISKDIVINVLKYFSEMNIDESESKEFLFLSKLLGSRAVSEMNISKKLRLSNIASAILSEDNLAAASRKLNKHSPHDKDKNHTDILLKGTLGNSFKKVHGRPLRKEDIIKAKKLDS